MSDDDEPFGLGLGDQKPVEWIPVRHRKIPRSLRVMKGERQVDKSPFLNQSRQVAWGGDPSLRTLYGNLPPGNAADKDVVARVGDVGAFSA